MTNSRLPESWSLGELLLTLDHDGDCYWICEQNEEGDMLSTLATLAYPWVAEVALDILLTEFVRDDVRFNSIDHYDALCAYSARPLPSIPEKFRDLLADEAWKSDQYRNVIAITLSGSPDEADRSLLLRMLKEFRSDCRDGPLWAANSFNEMRFVEAMADVAMSTSEGNMASYGERRPICVAFRRWLSRGVIGWTQLVEMLHARELSDPSEGMPAKRLLNWINAEHWPWLPYDGPSAALEGRAHFDIAYSEEEA